MVCMYSAFISDKPLPPLYGTVPAIFAKSSMLWTSLVYLLTNKSIRVKVVGCLKTASKESNHVSTSRGMKYFI